jgi:hypothetical protein
METDGIARQPKTIPPGINRQSHICSIKVGSGVQGISRFYRWVHESTGKRS